MDRYPGNLPIAEQSHRRGEVVTGPPRRRRWRAEEKARIIAESSVPGVVARSVALRHGVHPNLLYAWRRENRTAEPGSSCGFVRVTVAKEVAGRGMAQQAGAVEIALGGAVLRAAPGVEMDFLGAVLRAMRAAL